MGEVRNLELQIFFSESDGAGCDGGEIIARLVGLPGRCAPAERGGVRSVVRRVADGHTAWHDIHPGAGDAGHGHGCGAGGGRGDNCGRGRRGEEEMLHVRRPYILQQVTTG